MFGLYLYLFTSAEALLISFFWPNTLLAIGYGSGLWKSASYRPMMLSDRLNNRVGTLWQLSLYNNHILTVTGSQHTLNTHIHKHTLHCTYSHIRPKLQPTAATNAVQQSLLSVAATIAPFIHRSAVKTASIMIIRQHPHLILAVDFKPWSTVVSYVHIHYKIR